MNRKNVYHVRTATCVLLALILSFTAAVMVSAAGWEEALKKCTTYKFGDSREALTQVANAVKASSGNRGERLQIEKAFVKILNDEKATLECKDFICRQLWVIGTKESVPALAKMLTVKETSDMARYALETNPANEAVKALRDAMKDAEGAALVGIIDSLGERRDRESVSAISKLVFIAEEKYEDEDKEKVKEKEKQAKQVALAAINALGKIGGDEAAKTLAEARKTMNPEINRAATQALLLWGDNLNSGH